MDVEPDLRQLRYFVAVAEEASFTRAAQRLHLSQPALSAAIRQLERRLGTVLFARTGRRVELTPAGEALLTDARRLLAASQRLVERVTRVAAGEEGSVVLASTHSLSAAFVPELMGRLREALPRWRVRHRLGWSLEVTSIVAEGRATVGLVRYAESTDGLRVATLGREPAVVCVGRGHRLAGRSRVGLNDLAGERWAVMDREMSPRLVDVFIASCLASGFEPDIAERVSGADFQAMRPAFERIATGEAGRPGGYFARRSAQGARCLLRSSGQLDARDPHRCRMARRQSARTSRDRERPCGRPGRLVDRRDEGKLKAPPAWHK